MFLPVSISELQPARVFCRDRETREARLDVIMVGTWMLCGNAATLSGRYHGWDMDALWERTQFVWTLSWLAHGCSVGTDGVCLDVIMVGTWMLCGNGRSLSGRYHGWHMDALWERTEFVWTLSWLAHGCSVGTDGVCLGVIMAGTWMLCGNGRSLSGRYHGWHMDAVGTDGVCLDVIMVGTWMLCGNGRSLSGRYHGWDMDARWKLIRTTAGTTFSDPASPRNTVKYQGVRGLHARASAPPQNTREAKRSELQSPRITANTDAVGRCAARVNNTSVPLNKPY